MKFLHRYQKFLMYPKDKHYPGMLQTVVLGVETMIHGLK